ncbi:MAG: ATP-binding cassette domain-containing protein [Coprococcus sp.]|nr:ATP-binding cassette domain-containing protein [Coprococcus sp.]
MSEIRVRGLYKKIKGTVILDNINLDMNSGKIYGLKGKNGSGKSMLMRALCGLIIPDTGKISIDGEGLNDDIYFPRSVGALIENPEFLPNYSGYRNLLMLARLSGGINNRDIREAMNNVGLDPDDNRTYEKYSLGMKQKLGIANAIMGEPDVIILDEPINALDEETVAKIKKTLIGLKEKGKLIIIACHDREELEYLCDIIYEIKNGVIVGVEEVVS